MSSRTRLNIVLVAVLCLLGAIALLDPQSNSKVDTETLTPLEGSQVSRIVATLADRTTFEVHRDDQRWRFGPPVALSANARKVNKLLNLLSATPASSFTVRDDRLASYGLAPPRLQLNFGEVSLQLGDTDPINGRRYVRKDNTIYLVENNHYDDADRFVANFVHLAPLGTKATPTKLVLPQFTLTLQDGRWQVEPERANLSADAPNVLADRWGQARALKVVPFDPKLAWTDDIEIQSNGEPIRFQLTKREFDWIFGRPDKEIQYHFNASGGERLLELGAESAN